MKYFLVEVVVAAVANAVADAAAFAAVAGAVVVFVDYVAGPTVVVVADAVVVTFLQSMEPS